MSTVLFALGSNVSGQLGIGHKEDVSVPKQVLFQQPPDADDSEPTASCPGSIQSFAAGGNHTLLLTTSGTLHWSGNTSTGACGPVTPAELAVTPRFHEVDLSSLSEALGTTTTKDTDSSSQAKPVVTHIAATWEASLIAVRDPVTGLATHLFSFGRGNKGELGLGPFIFQSSRPQRVLYQPLTTPSVQSGAEGGEEKAESSEKQQPFPPPGTSIVDLAAGMAHVVAVLSNGEAWGWGNGRKGQLGPNKATAGDAGVWHSPRRIADVSFAVKRAVCGREFTCLVGSPETGEMLVLGSGGRSDKPSSSVPVVPSAVRGWRDVGASWGNVYVLDGAGKLSSWGRDDYGQVSLVTGTKRESDGKTGEETEIRASRMAVGSEHVVALLENGDVIAAGWGEHGNCGPAPKRENSSLDHATKGIRNVIASSKFVPEGVKITAIGAGCATSFVGLEAS